MDDFSVFREALDQTSLAVVVSSAGGRVEYANSAAAALLGSVKGIDLARPPAMDDPKGPLAAFVGLWNATRENPSAGSPGLLRARTPSGSIYLWANAVRAGSGPEAGLVFFLADMTEQVAGSEPVRRLVSQLAHDLRSPLTSISGAAELLLSGRVGGLETVQTKLVKIVDEGASKMANIITTASAEETIKGGSAA